jgi:hypothetical protein
LPALSPAGAELERAWRPVIHTLIEAFGAERCPDAGRQRLIHRKPHRHHADRVAELCAAIHQRRAAGNYFGLGSSHAREE